MKVTVGLLIFVCITVVTIHLAVSKKLDGKMTLLFLSFAVLSGFVAANYDAIRHLKFGGDGVELETAKQEISTAKSTALEEIDAEVKSQKESITLLISTANETSAKLEDQNKALSELISTATALQREIEKQKQDVVNLNQDGQKAKQDVVNLNQDGQKAKQEIVKLNQASSQIALALVRATYLTIETKNELGRSPRIEKATQEILNDINRILPMVIADPHQRSQWIQSLQNTLPKRE
ncbi:MAG: hypothetical protein A2498_10850 [Lentisphaerae bacterium RIFOXYC12_FULL_60_16]|nr:MAG: hypothetical protein A2498_10850 [Lentisphaerae bacterium RIFOXYC12_FULL_60_16]